MSTWPTEEFRRLPPRVSREIALTRFSRRRFPCGSRAEIGRLELAYLPLYVLAATVAELGEETRDDVLIGVDAVSGRVSRLDHRVELAADAAPPGDLLAPLLGLKAALRNAREEVPWLLLRVALRHKRRFPLEALELRDRVGYPYWVQHLRRRGRRDFRALDGLSGAPVGAAGRALLLTAFVASRTRS